MTKADMAAMDWLNKFSMSHARCRVTVRWPDNRPGWGEPFDCVVSLSNPSVGVVGSGKTLAAATRRARKALREAK